MRIGLIHRCSYVFGLLMGVVGGSDVMAYEEAVLSSRFEQMVDRGRDTLVQVRKTPKERPSDHHTGLAPKTEGELSVASLISAKPMTVGELVAKGRGRERGTEKVLPSSLPKEVASANKEPSKVSSQGIVVTVFPPNREKQTITLDVSSSEDHEEGDQTPKLVLENQHIEPAKAPQPAQQLLVEHAPKAKVQATKSTLIIKDASEGLSLEPKHLKIKNLKSKIAVQIETQLADELAIFVRDQNIVKWDSREQQLKAKASGRTELYVVGGGRMYILPVTVEDGGIHQPGPKLEVPAALVSLDGVFSKNSQNAGFPGLGLATESPLAAAASSSASATIADAAETAANATAPVEQAALSLNDSRAAALRTMHNEELHARRFAPAKQEVGYDQVTLQLVDERSIPEQGRLYPLSQVSVEIVGTEFKARTDATGHLTIRDMPRNSRFLLRITDPGGHIRPGIAELVTGSGPEAGVKRVKALRSFTFDAYTKIAGVAQDSTYASLCGTVTSLAGGGAGATFPTEGMALTLNVSAEGPFYFNRFGFLDRAQHTTGADGRFCFFNVSPGPAALTLHSGEATLGNMMVSLFGARHSEETIVLGREGSVTARLAAMATAHEQLSSNVVAANSYQSIDMIDLIPLGSSTPMMQIAPGTVQSEALLSSNGRVQTLAQAAEFEPVVYAHDLERQEEVTPLIPRGFIEDMSLYAQVVHDPTLGSVLIEHGELNGQGHENINLRLVNEYGESVGDGWYFADAPTTKAIFFNVPPGTYGVLAETASGYWVWSDTVTVYSETVSYVRTGSAVRYRP